MIPRDEYKVKRIIVKKDIWPTVRSLKTQEGRESEKTKIEEYFVNWDPSKVFLGNLLTQKQIL